MKDWKEAIKQEPCFNGWARDIEDVQKREDERKQYVANAIQNGKFTAEEVLCFFLQEMSDFGYRESFSLFENYANEISPKKVYEATHDYKLGYYVVEFVKFFGDRLDKEGTLDPNELFLDYIYGERACTLSDECKNECPISVLSVCSKFDANAATIKLYEALKECGEEDKFWNEILEELMCVVTDFTFLAPMLKKAVLTGDEFKLTQFGKLVKKGAIPMQEAKELVERLKKENPQCYEDLIEGGYADFDF